MSAGSKVAVVTGGSAGIRAAATAISIAAATGPGEGGGASAFSSPHRDAGHLRGAGLPAVTRGQFDRVADQRHHVTGQRRLEREIGDLSHGLVHLDITGLLARRAVLVPSSPTRFG